MIDAALRYSAPAKVFHWLSAATILTAIVLGFAMLESDPGPRQNQFFDLHRSFGFVILLLTSARLGWRLYCPPPPLVPGLPAWQERAAHVTHIALYGLLLIMPLVGWAGTSAFGARISVFGLFELPMILAKDEALSKKLLPLHGAMGLLLCALLFMHIGAALQPHLLRKDDTLRRMLPGG